MPACTMRHSRATPAHSPAAPSAFGRTTRLRRARGTHIARGLAGCSTLVASHPPPPPRRANRVRCRSAVAASTTGGASSQQHRAATSTAAWSAPAHTPVSTAPGSTAQDPRWASPNPACQDEQLTSCQHLNHIILSILFLLVTTRNITAPFQVVGIF